MNMKDRFKALLEKLSAAYNSIFAEPEELPTRRLKTEEIQERERQAALRDLERLRNQHEQ